MSDIMKIIKKYLITLAVFIGICFINSLLFAPEAEYVKVERPKEYEAPKTDTEAKRKLEEADRASKKAEEYAEKKKNDLEKAQEGLKKFDITSPEYKKAEETVEIAKTEFGEANDTLDEWKKQKDKLLDPKENPEFAETLKKYEAGLTAALEQPNIPAVKEPTWWQVVRDTVSNWFAKVKTRISEFLGIKKAVASEVEGAVPEVPMTKEEIINNLDVAMEPVENVIDSVEKTTPELTKLAEDLRENKKKVEDFQEAVAKGDVSEEQQEKAAEAVGAIVEDLVKVTEEIKQTINEPTTQKAVENSATTVLETLGMSKPEIDDLKAEVSTVIAAAPPPPPSVEKPIVAQKDITQNSGYKSLQEASKKGISGMSDFQLNKISLTYSSLENAINRGEFIVDTMPDEFTNFVTVVREESNKRREKAAPPTEYTIMPKEQKKQKLTELEDALKESYKEYNKAIKGATVSKYSDEELKNLQSQLNDYYNLGGKDQGVLRFRLSVITEISTREKAEGASTSKPVVPPVKPPEKQAGEPAAPKEDITQDQSYKLLQTALKELGKISLLKDARLNQVLSSYTQLEKSIGVGEFTVDTMPADVAGIKTAIEQELARRKPVVVSPEKKPTYDTSKMSPQQRATARDTLETTLKTKTRDDLSKYTLEELKKLDRQINDYIELVGSIDEEDALYKQEARDIMQFRAAIGTNIRVKEPAVPIPGDEAPLR